MVRHMMAANFPEQRQVGVLNVMYGVVHHVVGNIADAEATEKAPALVTYQGNEQQAKQCSQRNTDRDRHHQAVLVVWILVMHTVEQEADTILKFTFGCEVENIPVKEIFKQGPERDSANKQNDKGTYRYIDGETFPDKEDDNRQVDCQHRHR